ncbi:DNA primase noncatalytic subunit PriX [Candidatus Marsarchaeota archaeon]|nr:DNA primase noncatalytic subunit PriX [Candidatus Marsarchaeota archaeon]
MELSGISDEALDIAYKYPFSSEAKAIINSMGLRFEERFLRYGKIRVEKDLDDSEKRFEDTSMKEIKYMHLLSYIYSRMLISATGNRSLISKYIKAEAERASAALSEDSDGALMKIAASLGIILLPEGKEFGISFVSFLKAAPRNAQFSLQNQELSKGVVYLTKERCARFLESAIALEVKKNLPIPAKDLPKEVFLYAKGINIPEAERKEEKKNSRTYNWIEHLMETPIDDVRHRTINLILAPYLVNVKGIGEEDASKMINEYINRCKEINPHTNVNESYIRYQCRYAKSKGLKPLSLDKAKELLRTLGVFEE